MRNLVDVEVRGHERHKKQTNLVGGMEYRRSVEWSIDYVCASTEYLV